MSRAYGNLLDSQPHSTLYKRNVCNGSRLKIIRLIISGKVQAIRYPQRVASSWSFQEIVERRRQILATGFSNSFMSNCGMSSIENVLDCRLTI